MSQKETRQCSGRGSESEVKAMYIMGKGLRVMTRAKGCLSGR